MIGLFGLVVVRRVSFRFGLVMLFLVRVRIGWLFGGFSGGLFSGGFGGGMSGCGGGELADEEEDSVESWALGICGLWDVWVGLVGGWACAITVCGPRIFVSEPTCV